MRTKSETKRQAILAAASTVFRQMGYERASMEDIGARTGCSKATLYSHFGSKEELFYVCITEDTDAAFHATYALLDPDDEDVGAVLRRFGKTLLTLLYSPEIQSLRRLVFAEAGRSDIGKRCYELGPSRSLTAVADFLEVVMKKGRLAKADPALAARHLHGLLEAEWLYPMLFQTMENVTPAQIRKTVGGAVDVFLTAYRFEVAEKGTTRKRKRV